MVDCEPIPDACLLVVTDTLFDDTEMGDWCREYRPHMSNEELHRCRCLMTNSISFVETISVVVWGAEPT